MLRGRKDAERTPHPHGGGSASELRRLPHVRVVKRRSNRTSTNRDAGTFSSTDHLSRMHVIFFIRGHSFLTHAAITSSSRSTARLAGRCRLQPNR